MFHVDQVFPVHPQALEYPTVTDLVMEDIQVPSHVAYCRSWVSRRSNVTLFTRLTGTSLGGEREREGGEELMEVQREEGRREKQNGGSWSGGRRGRGKGRRNGGRRGEEEGEKVIPTEL